MWYPYPRPCGARVARGPLRLPRQKRVLPLLLTRARGTRRSPSPQCIGRNPPRFEMRSSTPGVFGVAPGTVWGTVLDHIGRLKAGDGLDHRCDRDVDTVTVTLRSASSQEKHQQLIGVALNGADLLPVLVDRFGDTFFRAAPCFFFQDFSRLEIGLAHRQRKLLVMLLPLINRCTTDARRGTGSRDIATAGVRFEKHGLSRARRRFRLPSCPAGRLWTGGVLEVGAAVVIQEVACRTVLTSELGDGGNVSGERGIDCVSGRVSTDRARARHEASLVTW